MNVLDVVLALVLIAFTAIGVVRGMVREIMSFVTWVAATVLGWLFAADIEGRFAELSGEYVVRMVLAFVTLFAVGWLAGILISLLAQRFIVRRFGLRWPNLLLGGVIGLVRGAVFVVVLFLFAGITSLPQRAWWRDSVIAPVFEAMARRVATYLPSDLAHHIRYG